MSMANVNLYQPWLEITTAAKCLVNCYHCPQTVYQQAYHGPAFLSFSDFSEALIKVPKNLIINFSGFSEPFLNSRAIDMMELAHELGYKVWLSSTLVGATPKTVDRLAKIGLGLFLFHLPDNLGNAHIPTTQNYKDTVVAAFQKLHVNGVSIMNSDFVSNERAGLCKDTKKKFVRGWFWCYKLEHPNFVMLPSCEIQLCCMSWSLKEKLGNLHIDSWQQILNTWQKRRQEFEICRTCLNAIPLSKYVTRRVYDLLPKAVKNK
jgi:hypothetical protein